jgi:hypothetical protein
VRKAVAEVNYYHKPIDILISNAAVMILADLTAIVDGLENSVWNQSYWSLCIHQSDITADCRQWKSRKDCKHF